VTVEEVVLLDESGRPCGRMAKSAVHHARTPLHLAFSCWLLDDTGRTLLTRRSLAKRTWPGVWTNAFCGHPAPGEPLEGAVHRRAWDELGVHIAAVRLVLPDFRYRAAMTDGTVENEVCPVYTARATDRPVPDPEEVADLRWVALADVPGLVASSPDTFSPWMQLQLPLLAGDLQR
jgi:isopentenyl-diphosphate delta-isomerase